MCTGPPIIRGPFTAVWLQEPPPPPPIHVYNGNKHCHNKYLQGKEKASGKSGRGGPAHDVLDVEQTCWLDSKVGSYKARKVQLITIVAMIRPSNQGFDMI